MGSIFGGNDLNTEKTIKTEQVNATNVQPAEFTEVETTGSIPKNVELANIEFSEQDWLAIMPELNKLLNSPTQLSVPPVWLNANSGAFGAIHVPLTEKVTQQNANNCKKFYVSLAHNSGQNWMSGIACKDSKMVSWHINDMQPSDTPL